MNRAASRRAGLSIRAKLLRLASRVIESDDVEREER
ncbi:hypothetical protein ACFL6U_13330 [Planctomycetota bacterium]